jgi:hypothetical protein
LDGDTYGTPAVSETDVCSASPGYVALDTDCNDDDVTINPDAIETCDGIDNNCDSVVDNVPGGCIITVQGKYDAIIGSGNIQLLAGEHAEDGLILDRDVIVKFIGEYDEINDELLTTITSLSGPTMTIIGGTVITENIILQ